MKTHRETAVYDGTAGRALMIFRGPACFQCNHGIVNGGVVRIALGRAFQLAHCPACYGSWVESIPEEEALQFLGLCHRPVAEERIDA